MSRILCLVHPVADPGASYQVLGGQDVEAAVLVEVRDRDALAEPGIDHLHFESNVGGTAGGGDRALGDEM